jgi:predicted ArsR family transcriptional regulator
MAIYVELIAIDAAARTGGEAMTDVTATQRAQAVQTQISQAREALAVERDMTIDDLGEIAREGFEAEWPRW